MYGGLLQFNPFLRMLSENDTLAQMFFPTETDFPAFSFIALAGKTAVSTSMCWKWSNFEISPAVSTSIGITTFAIKMLWESFFRTELPN